MKKLIAKFNGKTYEVKPTGNIIHKPAKSYTDFNGYDTDRPASNRVQLGMYDESGNKVFTVTEDGRIFKGSGQPIGGTKIKEIE